MASEIKIYTYPEGIELKNDGSSDLTFGAGSLALDPNSSKYLQKVYETIEVKNTGTEVLSALSLFVSNYNLDEKAETYDAAKMTLHPTEPWSGNNSPLALGNLGIGESKLVNIGWDAGIFNYGNEVASYEPISHPPYNYPSGLVSDGTYFYWCVSTASDSVAGSLYILRMELNFSSVIQWCILKTWGAGGSANWSDTVCDLAIDKTNNKLYAVRNGGSSGGVTQEGWKVDVATAVKQSFTPDVGWGDCFPACCCDGYFLYLVKRDSVDGGNHMLRFDLDGHYIGSINLGDLSKFVNGVDWECDSNCLLASDRDSGCWFRFGPDFSYWGTVPALTRKIISRVNFFTVVNTKRHLYVSTVWYPQRIYEHDIVTACSRVWKFKVTGNY